MTEDDIKTIKNKINATIEALKENIAALEFSVQQLPPLDDLDKTTRQEAISHKRTCEANIRGYMQKISRLEVAIKRVGSPDYGICIECDKPIEITKLKLMPETMYCVECHKL